MGKIPPRLVDINSDKFTMVIKNILNYVTPADYEAAKKYAESGSFRFLQDPGVERIIRSAG